MTMSNFKQFTKAEINASQAITADAKVWAILNLNYLNANNTTIFGTSTKVEKGAESFETYISYLQPADKVAKKTLCPGARMAGCRGPCLIQTGQLGMETGQNAATKRTVLYVMRRAWFDAQILREIDKAERRAAKPGNKPALFRINGTSDIPIAHIAAARPNSKFYDYSKLAARPGAENYDITFSASMYSKGSKNALAAAVKAGRKIAVAFNTKGIARDVLEIPAALVSFDETDLRHLDKPGAIGSLTRKDSNIVERLAHDSQAKSFFVTSANLAEFNNIIARSV
jgi:hypothetical protein